MARKACSTCMASSRVGSRMRAWAAGPRHSVICSSLDDGDEEAERFAGSGLRGGQHIAAFERGRNGAGLHRRGGYEIVGVEPRHEAGERLNCENWVVKMHSFLWVPGASISVRPATGTGPVARAHIGREPAIEICVRENLNRPWD